MIKEKNKKVEEAFNRGYIAGARSLNTGCIGPEGTLDDMVRRYKNKDESLAFRRGYVKGMNDHRRAG